MPAERVRKLLLEHGIPYTTEDHSVAFTAREVAHTEHITEDQVAKPVMLMADEKLVMAVLPGDRSVDLQRAKIVLKAKTVRLANEQEFAPLFPDCERGAEPPFGALYDVATVVDTRLQTHRVTFNAGTHAKTMTMALTDYLKVTNPLVVDIAAA